MTKEAFYSKWMKSFAADISEKDIQKYVVSTGNYIWHIFSWKLLNDNLYLTGNAAREAYDKIDKSGAVYIEWFDDGHIKDMGINLNTAKALDKFVEVYVVSKNFEWTYIKTHESTCGPYFMLSK